MFFLLFGIVFYVLAALGAWGTYKKAGPNGEPAWSAFVPVYNYIVLLRIVGRPASWAWFLLLLVLSPIPILGFLAGIAFFIINIFVLNDLSKSFGHEAPFTVGSIQLEDGPIVRTLIEVGEGATLAAGTRMATTLIAVVDADGRECLDLRFEPEPAFWPGARRLSIMLSTCSIRERLGMATLHLRAQALESAVLKLLHRTFASGQCLRNFTNAFLFHKTLDNHAPLVVRKLFHQSKQARAVFDRLQIGLNAWLGRLAHAGGGLPGGALELVRHRIGGDSE